MNNSRTKDPEATLDYAVDWTPFLAGTDGDTIATATFISPDGITIDDLGVDGNFHSFTAAGGTEGEVYRITSRITTVQGRGDDQTVTILILDK